MVVEAPKGNYRSKVQGDRTIIQGIMNHYRTTRKLYLSRLKKNDCPFCDPQNVAQNVQETPHAYIASNLTHYDLWEAMDVTDHLLILPKRHVLHFNELTSEESLDIMKLIAEYEAKGYSVYARAVKNANRNIPHQHTHLIKTAPRKPRGLLFLHKPYFLFKF
jgi:diadenosine tetraphosphate (Ap4A) HIT family hydrolase